MFDAVNTGHDVWRSITVNRCQTGRVRLFILLIKIYSRNAINYI